MVHLYEMFLKVEIVRTVTLGVWIGGGGNVICINGMCLCVCGGGVCICISGM